MARLPVLSAVCLVLVVVSPVAATPDTPPLGGEAQTQGPAIDPDTVVMRFHVRPDGSAVARVEYRLRLNDSTGTAAFERIRSDVANNRSTYVGRFERRARATAATAENVTGRRMRVENVSVRTSTESLPRSTGVLTYSFTWQGFATTDAGRLVVGDALAGLYLDESTRLLISWPDRYEVVTVGDVGERRENAAVWVGPRYFGRAGPRIELRDPGAGGDAGFPGAPLAAAVVVGAVALGGAFWWRRRGPGAQRRPGRPSSPASAEPTGASPDDAPGAANPPNGAPDGEGLADEPAPTADLLSNEERVLRLLERNDGRIKQQNVVDHLDWSEAKVSRVVSDLRDQGRVETFRLGNENVLALQEEEEESR